MAANKSLRRRGALIPLRKCRLTRRSTGLPSAATELKRYPPYQSSAPSLRR
jgi:hypothetical protein